MDLTQSNLKTSHAFHVQCSCSREAAGLDAHLGMRIFRCSHAHTYACMRAFEQSALPAALKTSPQEESTQVAVLHLQ